MEELKELIKKIENLAKDYDYTILGIGQVTHSIGFDNYKVPLGTLYKNMHFNTPGGLRLPEKD